MKDDNMKSFLVFDSKAQYICAVYSHSEDGAIAKAMNYHDDIYWDPQTTKAVAFFDQSQPYWNFFDDFDELWAVSKDDEPVAWVMYGASDESIPEDYDVDHMSDPEDLLWWLSNTPYWCGE